MCEVTTRASFFRAIRHEVQTCLRIAMIEEDTMSVERQVMTIHAYMYLHPPRAYSHLEDVHVRHALVNCLSPTYVLFAH